MPGFTIPKSDTTETPTMLLFHDERNHMSMIQHTAVTSMETDIEIDIIIAPKNPSAIEKHEIHTIPTTMLVDENGEVNRWEGPTHESDILPAIEELHS